MDQLVEVAVRQIVTEETQAFLMFRVDQGACVFHVSTFQTG